MTEKRVSVRLAVVGGREVRAELEGVGEAGNRGFGRLSREMEAANARLAGFSRAAKLAVAAAAGAFLAGAGAMIRSSLDLVDSQAKMAQSLRTTVESVQVLTWAGELAGVSIGEIEQATKKLTTRLSEAAQGSGSAVEALARLNLTAADLQRLPLDQRIIAIQRALATYVPEAQRAAVASDLFGDRAALAFLRIDTATLEEAARDVRDFGVAVSDADARQIERAGDAIARLGLIWRGLSNQLAVAAAPALEAVANAMAALARTTGPLGIAIRGLFDNIGRLTAYAATFAGIMAGRWVAGLVVAAVSVRGLATALVVLRGALIRTGIGALIVGAGELVYQFGRLVAGAGGFGEALSLLGGVAAEVWERIKLGGRSLALSLQSVWATIEAGWLTALSGIQRSWADFLHAATRGLDGVPGMESTMLRLSEAAIRAGSAFYETSAAAGEASARADGLAASAAAAASAATAPLASLQALRDAVKGSAEETETALGGATVAADEFGDSIGKVGGASAAAAPELAEAPEVAKSAWQLATEAVRDYADKAKETGQGIGEALTSGFRGAEDAVAEFVKTGKLGMRDLVASILADLAKVSVRRFVLAPIANALSGVLGSLGPAFASVLHSGGVVGSAGPLRSVPVLAFAGAPRMHAGGVAGLRPDEVPAILQRGERVLSRAETRTFDRARGDGGVIVNIMTTDAESFRRSRTQVAIDIARAVAFGRRGM